MKAKVKSLGSVVDLSEYVYDEDGNEYTWDEVELIDDDKWQHYRIQAAIAAMDIVNGAYNIHNDMERLVRHSVKLADALIEELKKGGGDADIQQ